MHARIGWQNLRTSEFLDSGDYLLVTGTDFEDGRINYATCHYVERERYLIPSSAWNNPDGVLLVSRDYPRGKSEPEFGVNVTKKSMPLLEKYEITTATIKQYFE